MQGGRGVPVWSGPEANETLRQTPLRAVRPSRGPLVRRLLEVYGPGLSQNVVRLRVYETD